MKFTYDGETYDEEEDVLTHCLVDHSDDVGDGTYICKHCGEVMEESDMAMHIAYTHGLVMLVEV